MRQATNCILIAPDGRILLSMKKRGLGVGKWNGAGGKVQEGESVEEAAVREIQEEIMVSVDPLDLEKVAEVLYDNADGKGKMFVHIFLTRKWVGEPSESNEMRPQWFELKDVDFKQTWADMPHWLPRVLAGEKLKAEFVYKSNVEYLDHYEVLKVEGF